MTHTPIIALRFCNILVVGLIDALSAEKGWPDTLISRDATRSDRAKAGTAEAVKTIRAWDGSNQAPSLRTVMAIEDHVRTNLGEEAYQRAALSLLAMLVGPSIDALAEETGDAPEAIFDAFVAALQEQIESDTAPAEQTA